MVEILSASHVAPEQAKMSGESLRNALNDHLERYLNLLHQYQSLQQSLAKDLSSGYFSLAQANFSNPNRIRYGQDFYDERMQALTRFNVSSKLEEMSDSEPIDRCAQEIISVTTLKPMSKQPETNQAMDNGRSAETGKDAEPKAPISDPLRWFGVLVSPALRISQKSFRNAVTEAIPALLNVSNEMKSLEIEIRRTRKKIRKQVEDKQEPSTNIPPSKSACEV